MKPKFKIGDHVRVRGTVESLLLEITDTKTRRLLVRNNCEKFHAVVAGATYKQEGTYHPASGGYSTWHSEYEPDYAYLDVDADHFVYLVRRGLTNKEILVFEADLELVAPQKFPIRFSKQPEIPQQYRDMLRKTMLEVPRDSKGRWLKS